MKKLLFTALFVVTFFSLSAAPASGEASSWAKVARTRTPPSIHPACRRSSS